MKRCTKPVELHNLDDHSIPDGEDMTIQEYAELYTHMMLIRLMEERLSIEYSLGNVRGFCHLTIGQEGLYAVLMKVLKNSRSDRVISSYRCHGAAYATGCTIKEIICENLGLIEGNNRGKGGSMHLYNDKFYGGHGIVGAQISLGTGIAFSIKYKGYRNRLDGIPLNSNDHDYVKKSREDFVSFESDGVCFSIFGDGATNQGQAYESYNMAKIYNLPIVFIVENNKYGMYTPIENVCVDDCFYKRGYGIPGIRLSDTNTQRLKTVIGFAREYSMKNGPIIVQVDTYRLCGHSAEDFNQSYKVANEQSEEKAMDGLKHLEATLINKTSEDYFMELKTSVLRQFDKEIDGIDTSKKPEQDDIYIDLYYN